MTGLPMPEDRDESVYFLQDERDPGGYVKIGCAQDVRKRMRRIQRMSPVRLRLIGVLYGAGQETEAYLHRLFAEHRCHGEWFVADAALMAFVRKQTETPPARSPEEQEARARRIAARGTRLLRCVDSALPDRKYWSQENYGLVLDLKSTTRDEIQDDIDILTWERDERYGEDADDVPDTTAIAAD